MCMRDACCPTFNDDSKVSVAGAAAGERRKTTPARPSRSRELDTAPDGSNNRYAPAGRSRLARARRGAA
jgi:hypothetical protein